MTKIPPEATAVIDAFQVSDAQLRSMIEGFKKEVQLGLSKDGQQIKCLPSYVTALPPPDLKCTSLALDLGGTNFRVCSVEMDHGNVVLDQEKFAIPNKAKETKEGLFGFLAESVKMFIETRKLEGEINLGFTFSFPVLQTSICSGTLVTWTKGFTTPGVVDQDVVLLLKQASEKLGLRPGLHITALVNDTVGTLMAHAVTDVKTRIGMIVGTGFNAAYVEKRHNVTKMGPPQKGEAEDMVINLESGNFGSCTQVLPLNKYDKLCIDESTAPREQWFEKMVSGKYLGEQARMALLELHEKGNVFKGKELSEQLKERHGLDTGTMSKALAKPISERAEYLGQEIGINFSPEDVDVCSALFEMIGARSAKLSGALVAGLIEHMGEPCTVAVDGSVFEYYPGFRETMKKTVDALLGSQLGSQVAIALGKDGSGVGAGVIAALA